VRAYVIRRLLLMVPTLFGVTLLTFLIIKMAPGDPLQLQLSQTGAQGESQNTREAYLLQRRQWKLDKPTLLNFNWFSDFADEARLAAAFRGMTEGDLSAELGRMASLGDAEDERLEFLRGLGIERFDARLREADRRALFTRVVATAIQLRVESLSDHGIPPLVALLRQRADLKLRIGAIRALNDIMLGDPFVYTYSMEPLPEETEGVVSTWAIWWKREEANFRSLDPARAAEVEKRFRALVDEPSRGRILEGMASFARTDAPFFASRLLAEGSSLKERYVASLALRSHLGRPLRVDVRLEESADAVEAVASNWIAFYEARKRVYEPGLPARLWYLLTDTQYANSVGKLVTFSFGKSMVKPYDPVGQKIWTAAKVSIPLMFMVEVFIYLFAVPAGIACAVRRGKFADRAISVTLFFLYSMPSFVAAMLFLTFFCYGRFLKWFPMFGLHSENADKLSFIPWLLDYGWHAFLPVICLSIFSLAGIAMYSRTSMLDVVTQDYIRTARAKGLRERTVILKHALRNGLIPVLTLFSNFLPALLGGQVIIEYLFGIPGMGRLSLESILAKDYNTLMALIYIDAIIVLGSILLTDLLYVVVDPRISFAKAGGGA